MRELIETRDLEMIVVVGYDGTIATLSVKADDDAKHIAAEEDTFWRGVFDAVGSALPDEVGIPDVPTSPGCFWWMGIGRVWEDQDPDKRNELDVEFIGEWQELPDVERPQVDQ
jgi:hypothetical protein